MNIRLYVLSVASLWIVAVGIAPCFAGGGTLNANCGIVCSPSIACGGHLQPACSSGGACDGNNVLFVLPDPYVYSCPGFPCSGGTVTYTQGCYDPTNPPTCGQCGASGQYQCGATGCSGGRCEPGLTPDSNGYCVVCGGEGQPICEDGDPICDAGLNKAGNTCYSGCGGAAELPCPNLTCQDWHFFTGIVCAECGGDPEIPGDIEAACPTSPGCRPDIQLDLGVCFNCGQNGEPECSGVLNSTCSDGAGEIGPNQNGNRACAFCGGPGEVACETGPCDSGLLHITDSNLAGDIDNCLTQFSNEDRHYIQQNGFCSGDLAEPMTRTAPESWPAEEESAAGRNTVFLIHGRGSSCGGSMASVLNGGRLFDTGHRVYCVQYAQEGNQNVDDRAVQILPVIDDVYGNPQPSCAAGSSCAFDSNNPVADLLAPTPAGETVSVPDVGIALRDAILKVPVEGDITLVAHSQGGFIARELIYSHYDELRWAGRKISRVINLGHPHYTKHADPHLYSPWTCRRDDNFDCSTGRWTWGWDLNAPGAMTDADYPQIEWNAVSGTGVLGDESEDSNGDGQIDATDDACLYNFGGVWADDVLYDSSVPVESSLGYDEFGFFQVQDLAYDRKFHGVGGHTASVMLEQVIVNPVSCQPGGGIGSASNTCAGADADAGVLPFSTDLSRMPDVLDFDGLDDAVSIDDPAAVAALNIDTEMTIDAWVNVRGYSGLDYIVVKEGEYWLAIGPDGNIGYATADGNWVGIYTATYKLPHDSWTHLTLSFEGSVATRLYVNGRLEETWSAGSDIGDVATSNDQLQIGHRNGNSPLNGRLDDLRIWNVALDASEVAQIVNRQPNGLLASPLVWYRFDEEGDQIADSSGNGYHGSISALGADETPVRQRTRREDNHGGAIYLDGTDDRAAIDDPAARARLEMDDAMTLEGWVFLRDYGTPAMIVNKNSEYWLAVKDSGEIGFAVANQVPGWVGVYSDSVVPLRTWTHMAFVYEVAPSTGLGTAKLYVDGQFRQQWDVFGMLGQFNSADGFSFGALQSGGNYLSGALDEIRIWDVARSASEILQNYNRTLPSPESENGLVGYWDFDERFGDLLFDRSGNGNHAILGVGTGDTKPLRSMAPHLPTYRLIYPGECGNGFIDPMEDCDLSDTDGGDGCSATCRNESIFELMGDADGGTVSIDVEGITVTVTTHPGQTAEEIATALAAAILADSSLASLGVSATSIGDQLFVGGEIDNPVIADTGLMDCSTGLPLPTIDGFSSNLCPETGVTLSTDASFSDYQWFVDGRPIEGADGPTLEVSLTGEYGVQVGDGSGCRRDSFREPVFVSFCPETEISPAQAVFPLKLDKETTSPTGYAATFQDVDGIDGFHWYEGTLGAWYDHGSSTTCALESCAVGNEVGCYDDLGAGQLRTVMTPGSGDRYFLISGYAGGVEGPAGYDSGANRRDVAQETCLP